MEAPITIVVGGYHSALGVVRALGMRGVHVVLLTYEHGGFAAASTYVSEQHAIPHPERATAAFIGYLVAHADAWRGALIIDTDDAVAVVLSEHKRALEQYYRLVVDDWRVISLFIEKQQTYRLADACGIAHARTFQATSCGEVARVGGLVEYPCILKPIRGHEFRRQFHTKVFRVHDADELLKRYRVCQAAHMPVLVQEVVEGPDSDIYKMQTYINSKGESAAKFFYRKLRQHPPRFGVGRVSVSTERQPEVEALSEKLLAEAGFRGMCNVEFKRDQRDGQLKLIEVNIRMSRINWLPTYCGVNFPWLIYADLVQGAQFKVDSYRTGVPIIEIYTDVYNSLFHHSEESITLADYIRPYRARDKTFCVFSRGDPGPFVRQTAMLPGIGARRAKRRLREWGSARVAVGQSRQMPAPAALHVADGNEKECDQIF